MEDFKVISDTFSELDKQVIQTGKNDYGSVSDEKSERFDELQSKELTDPQEVREFLDLRQEIREAGSYAARESDLPYRIIWEQDHYRTIPADLSDRIREAAEWLEGRRDEPFESNDEFLEYFRSLTVTPVDPPFTVEGVIDELAAGSDRFVAHAAALANEKIERSVLGDERVDEIQNELDDRLEATEYEFDVSVVALDTDKKRKHDVVLQVGETTYEYEGLNMPYCGLSDLLLDIIGDKIAPEIQDNKGSDGQ